MGGVISDVLAERKRQDEKWGGPTHDDAHTAQEWCCILAEHAGHFSGLTLGGANLAQMRAEAVQIAAITLAIVESIDRNGGDGA